ncbi:MAG: LysM peptidoglycan-binding domain-containing protein, partial [Ardenticatenales bacterium]|nr:LysM peptidoglycan-binding domain-containing protein [Ardenticatenales bacterium]
MNPSYPIRRVICLFLLLALLVACRQPSTESLALPTSTPPAVLTLVVLPTRTLAPTSTLLAPTPTVTPTVLPTPVATRYEIQPGDNYLSIALDHNITLEELLAINQLTGDETLRVGETLIVPLSIPVSLPPSYLVHDSEVVYGRAYVGWDTAAFVAAQGGFLADYREGDLSGAEIIDAVAAKYHVGPRVLLAAMETLSGWVSSKAPHSLSPFGLEGEGAPDLQWQSGWAARQLMEGYYGQLEGRRDWVVLKGSTPARLSPGTNAGSAAVANLLAAVEPASTFPDLLLSERFQQSYHRLFGEVEGGAVLPPERRQPFFELPFPEEELWYFTGGPHGGWGDSISGWAALDFAPPVARGCWPSAYPIRAVADGLVVSSDAGEVWVDLDGDGDLRTGWVLLYMHLYAEGRVGVGTSVRVGDLMGYPSCEGGVSNASHLHLARLYDGQWMPAAGPVPFQLGDWSAEAVVGSSYDGFLKSRRGMTLKACDCRSRRQNRFPEKQYVG